MFEHPGTSKLEAGLGDHLIVSPCCVHRVIISFSCALVQTAPWSSRYKSPELAESSAIGATRSSGKSECGCRVALGSCLLFLQRTTATALCGGGAGRDRVFEPGKQLCSSRAGFVHSISCSMLRLRMLSPESWRVCHGLGYSDS